MIFLQKIKNTTKKRTSKAPENMCKMSCFLSNYTFYISETYGHFAKNADVTKVRCCPNNQNLP